MNFHFYPQFFSLELEFRKKVLISKVFRHALLRVYRGGTGVKGVQHVSGSQQVTDRQIGEQVVN
jgi:hypothetical protein